MKLELHDDQIFVDADEEVSNILQQYSYLFSGTTVQNGTLFTSLQFTCMYMIVVVLSSNDIFMLCHLICTV